MGCNIYVANPTDTAKEYALMARLVTNGQTLSEEALPVFGYTWFKVEPGDFITLKGALRFNDSDADLTVQLIEKESGEVTDSVTTRLVCHFRQHAALPPAWPGSTGSSGGDWSSLLNTLLPFLMIGIVAMVMLKPQKEKGTRGSSRPKRNVSSRWESIMPGEFYIEGKQAKVDLSQIIASLADLSAKVDALQTQIDKLAGLPPVTDSVTADWQTAEADVVSIGAADTRYKLHSLLLSIHNLVGTVITVRLYMKVKGVERKVYEQAFNAATDPPGLWLVNGTVGNS